MTTSLDEQGETEVIQQAWTRKRVKSQRNSVINPDGLQLVIANKGFTSCPTHTERCHLLCVTQFLLLFRKFAGLWAASQNSIINVWIDLLHGISGGWLWGCRAVCCESEVLATFRQRTIAGRCEAIKAWWIDQNPGEMLKKPNSSRSDSEVVLLWATLRTNRASDAKLWVKSNIKEMEIASLSLEQFTRLGLKIRLDVRRSCSLHWLALITWNLTSARKLDEGPRCLRHQSVCATEDSTCPLHFSCFLSWPVLWRWWMLLKSVGTAGH